LREELDPQANLEPRPLADASIGDLVGRMAKDGVDLVKKEVELARAELKENVQRQISMGKTVAVAAALGVIGLTIALMSIVLVLAERMAPWAAALLVGGVVLVIAVAVGLIGWGKRVRRPLARTRRTLKDDVHWAKEGFA
jgi:uncharacterized membrane protein YqjE